MSLNTLKARIVKGNYRNMNGVRKFAIFLQVKAHKFADNSGYGACMEHAYPFVEFKFGFKSSL
jgi:hypothetical protein